MFIHILWKHLNLPAPTDIQNDIARYLQMGPRRCLIEAFRGVGKSWLTAGFVVWLLLNNPKLKILVVSASKDRADQFSSFVKRIIAELPIAQHLQPRQGQRDSMISFDVGPARPDHSPSVKSVGITGQMTGSRADVIIADDVEVPNNSMTQTQRDQLSERVKEFDAILKPGGRVIYLGTPQTEMSLYTALPERGYEVRVWPALYPTLKQINSYKGTLAPYITRKLAKHPDLAGTTTDPKRFSDEDLNERRVSYGKAGFALQFMLDTSLADVDRYPLKLSDLIVLSCSHNMAPVKLAWASSPELSLPDLEATGLTGDRYYRPMWISPDMADYGGSVMSIDPAGRGADEVGYSVVKNLFSNLYLTAAGGMKGGYSEANLTKLALLAKAQNVNCIVIESNFGDGMFTQLFEAVLRKHHKCEVIEQRSQGQKEKRIMDTLEPVLGAHRLVVDPKVIQEDFATSQDEPRRGLFYQMTRLTTEKGSLGHDDRLDALAIAVKYWQESMARDQEKAVENHRDGELMDTLKNFMRNALGKRIGGPARTSALGANRAFRGR